MKKAFTVVLFGVTLFCKAQTPSIIYSPYKTPDRIVADDKFLYVVYDSSIHNFNTDTDVASKLFNKPWGKSLNTSEIPSFSNGKAILPQKKTLFTQVFKHWVYDGTTFDSLFSITGQVTNLVKDGDVCYFYKEDTKQVFRSDFTKAGTFPIATLTANTLLVQFEVYNHELYFFNTLNDGNSGTLKKYRGTTLSVLDSLYGYSFGVYHMYKGATGLYYSKYQFSATPEKYAASITKVDAKGNSNVLYNDITSKALYVYAFMGELKGNLLLALSSSKDAASSTSYLYQFNEVAGIPDLLKASTGEALRVSSTGLYLQGASQVYFGAYIVTDSKSIERDLWVTDGTSSGTVKVPGSNGTTHSTGAINGNVESWLILGKNKKPCGNQIYTILASELWKADGSTVPAKVSLAGTILYSDFYSFNGTIYAQALNSSYKPVVIKYPCEAVVTEVEQERQAAETGLLLYPDPAQEYITLVQNGTMPEGTKIYVHSILGVKLFESTFSGTEKIPVSHLQSGIYVVTTSNRLKKTFIKE